MGRVFDEGGTPLPILPASFEGSVERPPSPPKLCALSASAFNSSLFFCSGMDREQTPFDIRPEAKLFRINTCKTASKQTALTAFRINTSWGRPHFAQFWYNLTPFRINTCKSVSKQTTLTSFRMNTYEKHRGVGEAFNSPFHLPYTLPTSKFRIPQPLCLPLLRKHPGCGGILPILECAICYFTTVAVPPGHCSTVPGAEASLRA